MSNTQREINDAVAEGNLHGTGDATDCFALTRAYTVQSLASDPEEFPRAEYHRVAAVSPKAAVRAAVILDTESGRGAEDYSVVEGYQEQDPGSMLGWDDAVVYRARAWYGHVGGGRYDVSVEVVS